MPPLRVHRFAPRRRRVPIGTCLGIALCASFGGCAPLARFGPSDPFEAIGNARVVPAEQVVLEESAGEVSFVSAELPELDPGAPGEAIPAGRAVLPHPLAPPPEIDSADAAGGIAGGIGEELAAAARLEAGGLPPLEVPPAPAGPLVSETFVETDVREALQMLALQAHAVIIVDEQVGGVTSAVIENEPFEVALERVLLPLGFVFRREDNQYLVGVPDPASALFARIAERHDYHTSHLAPSELIELLPERLKRFVRPSEKRNLIIVEAPQQIAEAILEQLAQSDQASVQVVLEAMVCVMSPESGLQAGVDFEQGIRLADGSTIGMAISALNLAGTYGAVGPVDFEHTSATIRALARQGLLSVRAAPRVMAKDGETAKITIGKESYFSTQPFLSQSLLHNPQFLFTQQIEKIEAGIELEITPVVRGDRIGLKIDKAEVSEAVEHPALIDSRTSAFPVVNRRRVSTTVHVRDGETVTIGGLSQRQQVERVNRVPILGSIPYIGLLFTQIDRREEEVEVVVFISPKVVREGQIATPAETSFPETGPLPPLPAPQWEGSP